MIKINCDRCNKPIKPGEQVELLRNYKGHKVSKVLCIECNKLDLEFITPAFIPDMSLTQYDLRFRKKEKNKKPYEILMKLMREMKAGGMTVPEIAQELHICNKCVVNLTRKSN